ncbi:aquaporin-like [Chironomus tepperi]|uniref:aquaporin-like n=1 Tax=Chironomus tepperi TaxID=113505 RepID=UPI00391F0562
MIASQHKILTYITLFFSELLGTATLVFLGCLGCVDNFPGFEPTHLTICLCFGFAVMMSLNIFICVSGAHINPIVTLAALIYKRVDIFTSVLYVVGQMCGGLFGYWLVRLSIEDKYIKNPDGFCVNQPGLDVGRAFVVEFITSFLLVLVVCSIWDPRNKHVHDAFTLKFGFCVVVLAFVGGTFGGGSMNPARSFGPAIYNWNWENHWMFWAAPTSGGLAATLMFRYAFHKEEEKTEVFIKNVVSEDNNKEDA